MYIKTTEDYQPVYSSGFDIPQTKPFISTGFLLLNGDLTVKKEFNQQLEAKKYDHFTEQSIFAFFSKKFSSNTWSLRDIYVRQSDHFTKVPFLKKYGWLDTMLGLLGVSFGEMHFSNYNFLNA